MKHLSEEQLIEHHYGESNASVERHLEVCEELRKPTPRWNATSPR